MLTFWIFLNIAAGFTTGLILYPFKKTPGLEEYSISLIRLFIGGGLFYFILSNPTFNITKESCTDFFKSEPKDLWLAGRYLSFYVLGFSLIILILTGIAHFGMDTLGIQKDYFPSSPDFTRFKTLDSSAAGGVALYLIGVCLIAPIIEEIFYRQLLYVELRKKLGPIPSISFSALFFGLFHSNIIVAALDGAYLSYVYEKEKNLIVNIILHALLNILSILLMAGLKYI
ncbi:MAG TPA: type II CAAX endopeptidase family protein [Elusimicrobiales bacterium]|nr:type II CAAX endopeptidase family protein [Elusimicrobiales bacterium]